MAYNKITCIKPGKEDSGSDVPENNDSEGWSQKGCCRCTLYIVPYNILVKSTFWQTFLSINCHQWSKEKKLRTCLIKRQYVSRVPNYRACQSKNCLNYLFFLIFISILIILFKKKKNSCFMSWNQWLGVMIKNLLYYFLKMIIYRTE